MLACVFSIALFYKYMTKNELLSSIGEGATSSLFPCGCMGAVVGFAAVVQTTDAFQTMINRILNINVSPIVLIIVSIALICALTGGSTTGLRIALPIISPALLEQGVTAEIIHRVGAFASTTIDSLPHSGAIQMAVSIAGLKMKEGYPAIFVTTTIATIGGTLVTVLIMSLFLFLP